MKEVYRYINEKELNEYEKEHNLLSYSHLIYDDESLILCNEFPKVRFENMELYSGNESLYDEESDTFTDIYQYYLINEITAERLSKINEIIYYDNELDLYILGVTHFGTAWSYVLTDIKLEKQEDGYYCAYYEIND